jgi:hypothetical protein
MLFETIKKALLPVAIADNLAGHFAPARHAFSVAAGTINKLLLCSFG